MANNVSRTSNDEISLRKAIELDPQTASNHFDLGYFLSQDPSRLHESEASYCQAIKLEPNNARYIYRLGLLLQESMHSHMEAESAYRRAIELEPANAYFYGGLVGLLVQQSRQSDALEVGAIMRELLNANEQWYGLATLDAMLGNIDAAVESLKKAALKPGFKCDWARIDPDLASIRSHEGFIEIVGVV